MWLHETKHGRIDYALHMSCSGKDWLSMSSCNFTLPDDIPPHPLAIFAFPKRNFGQKKVVERSFRAEWLHYLESPDVVLCHFSVKTLKDFEMSGTVVMVHL